MNIETIENRNNEFEILFNQKIKPFIDEQINLGEEKVILSEEYIIRKLETYYIIDTLYTKIKRTILETNLGVSIDKKSKEFIFYKTSEDVKRESNLFEKNFRDKIIPIILKKFENTYIIGFEENFLKKLLNIDYNTDNIYQRLRNILLNGNMSVSIEKNIFIKGKKTNEFVFYDIDKKRKIDKENIDDLCKTKEIDKDKEDFDNYILESKERESIEKEKEKIVRKEIINNFFIDLNTDNLGTDFNEYNDNAVLCPFCKRGKIEYPETICPSCNEKVIKKWD